MRILLGRLIVPLQFVCILWLVKCYEYLTGDILVLYGVFPRDPSYLTGILTAPLVHADFEHLLSNSIPLIVLGWMLLYFYPRAATKVFVGVYLGSGLLVWFFGRPTFHIGASGLIYGIAFFLLVISLLRRDIQSMAIVALLIIFYGGMIWGLLPVESRISFESHIAGAVMGILLAYRLRDSDLPPPPPPLQEDGVALGEPDYKYIYHPREEDDHNPSN
ncbi:MAG: rhomboid family intramembrane serine protease [Chitinophagales bacterium]|nr:rhomboid family intramembrane serine protease [Chitinophagales bacterium]